MIYETYPNSRRFTRTVIDTSGWTEDKVDEYVALRFAEKIIAVVLREEPSPATQNFSNRNLSNSSLVIYPNGRIDVDWWTLSFYLRSKPRYVKTEFDFAPLPISDSLRIDIKHSYEVWSALFDHHADIDQWPHIDFEKILLQGERRKEAKPIKPLDGEPAAQRAEEWEPEIVEIDSPEMLADVIRLRRQRHNAAINAKHTVEPDYLPLVEAVKQAYEAAPPLSIDDQPFIDAWAALEAFDVESKMQAAAALDAQAPSAKTTLPERKAQAKDAVRRAAGKRIHALTGRTGWYGDLTLAGQSVPKFVQMTDEAVARIDHAKTLFEVNHLLSAFEDYIKTWHFDFTLDTTVEIDPLNRMARLYVHVSRPALVVVSLQGLTATVDQPSKSIPTLGCLLFEVSIPAGTPQDFAVGLSLNATETDVVARTAQTLSKQVDFTL